MSITKMEFLLTRLLQRSNDPLLCVRIAFVISLYKIHNERRFNHELREAADQEG